MLYEVCVYIYTLKMLKSDWDQYFRLSHKLSVKVKTTETIDRIPVFKVVFFKKAGWKHNIHNGDAHRF